MLLHLLKSVSRSPKTGSGTHIFGDWRAFDASQDIPEHRFHNADERVEHGKGSESGTGDWESGFLGLLQRNRHVEESRMRRRTNKSVDTDSNSSGCDVGNWGKAPAKLDVANEELDEHVGGDDEDEDHHGTCWIA